MSLGLRGLLVVLLTLLAPQHIVTVRSQSTVVPTSIVSAPSPSSTGSPNSLSTIPECTLSCLTSATVSLPCGSTDTECLCAHSQQIHDRTLTCLAGSTCSESDITLTANYYDTLCVSLGYPLSAVPSGSSAVATGTTSPSPSATSTNTPSTSGSTSPSSSNTSLKIPIIVGIAVGAALLLTITLITCCWLFRRRRNQEQKDQEEKQNTNIPPPIPIHPHPASSIYSPTSNNFAWVAVTGDSGSRKESQFSTSSTTLTPVQPTSQSKPSSRRKSILSQKSGETIFTMVSLADLDRSRSQPMSNRNSKPQPNKRVREIEINRSNHRVISEEIVLEEDDDITISTVYTEEDDSPPVRSPAKSRAIPISPGYSKFDFGLGSDSGGEPASRGSDLSRKDVWGDGALEKSRHFV